MRQLVSTQNLFKVWFVQVSLMLWPTGVGGALISNLLCTTKIIGPSTPNSKSITGSYKYTLPGHNIRYAWTNQNSELCFCHCDLWTTLRAQKVILTPYKPLQHIPILVASYFLNSRLVNSERIKTRSRKGMIVENIQYFVGRWQTLHPRLLWNVTLKAPSRLPSARAGVQTATKVSAGLITNDDCISMRWGHSLRSLGWSFTALTTTKEKTISSVFILSRLTADINEEMKEIQRDFILALLFFFLSYS